MHKRKAHDMNTEMTLDVLLPHFRQHLSLIEQGQPIPKLRVHCNVHSIILRMHRPTLFSWLVLGDSGPGLLEAVEKHSTRIPTTAHNCPVVFTHDTLVAY